jgi:CBS domain-containing protein
MLLRDILSRKGGRVSVCSPFETLEQAVNRLVHENIGSLVVCSGNKLVGILTERDILRKSATAPFQFASLTVAECMTPSPITGTPEMELTFVMGLMTDRRIRHLPVLEGNDLVGLISIGDLVKSHYDELACENHYLRNYLNI